MKLDLIAPMQKVAVVLSLSLASGTYFGPTAGSAATRSTGVTGIPAPSCSLNYSTPGQHCAGLLPPNFKTSSNTVQARLLVDAWRKGDIDKAKVWGDTYRTSKCSSGSCPHDQYAFTEVNIDSRKFSPQDLKTNNSVVVIGSMRLSPGKPADKLYGAGANLDNTAEHRHVFFVMDSYVPVVRMASKKTAAAKSSASAAPPTGDMIVAHWMLYRIDPAQGGDTAHMEREGLVTMCGKPHKPPYDQVGSTFQPCPQQERVHQLATLLKYSVAETMSLFTCEAGRLEKALVARDSECAAQISAKQGALLASLQRQSDTVFAQVKAAFAEIKLDSYDDPYWFSCSAGCCTADNIM